MPKSFAGCACRRLNKNVSKLDTEEETTMTKPLTYHKPSGAWGIEGVDLSTLSPQVYGALNNLEQKEGEHN